MYFKTEILCKLLPAKPALSARAIFLTRPPDWCTNMLYINICMHPSVANDWQHIATYRTIAYLIKTYLFFMAKYITTVLKGFFPSSILDKLSYDLTRSS
jgi:hypothetical protein